MAIDVLGVPISPITWESLREEVVRRVSQRIHTTVMYANVHVVNSAQHAHGLREALRAADIVYCDGTGVRVGARVLGHTIPERMTGADFIWDLFRRLAEVRARVFWVGGADGTCARALDVLTQRHPGVVIAGSHHGYFDKVGPASTAVVTQINAARPDLVLVGMGTPLQERWVADHRAAIDAPVVWAIGATADFVAGVQPRGPGLLTDHGFEWLARLASDPRRLFGRYVVGNPLFMARVLRARLARALRAVGR